MPTNPDPARRRERFTMLEPKGLSNLADGQKSWPAAEGREAAPDVGASDLATIRGLTDRLGAARLQ